MKNPGYLIPVISIALIISGCSKKTEDEFKESNPEVAKKYIKTLQVISNDNKFDNKTFTVNYDSENHVSSITDGVETGFSNFNSSGELNILTSGSESFDVNDLYQAPYKAFEVGEVMKYDAQLNPVKIQVYENGYGTDILIGTIVYDPNPNPYFYTLQAAGIIAVLDRVEIYPEPSDPKIEKLRQLMPYNNIRSIIFRDLSGNTRYEAQFTYNYNTARYPVNANITILTPEETSTVSLIFYYN